MIQNYSWIRGRAAADRRREGWREGDSKEKSEEGGEERRKGREGGNNIFCTLKPLTLAYWQAISNTP